jgi:hypothetical protein
VGLNSLKSLNLTNVYPNKNNNKKNNKVKSKPLELRSRVKKTCQCSALSHQKCAHIYRVGKNIILQAHVAAGLCNKLAAKMFICQARLGYEK